MAYLGTKPANQVIDSTLIADGTVTTSDLANQAVTQDKIAPSAQYMGFKNRIINGAMMIAQRGTGTITADTTNQFPVDRFKCNGSTSGKYTAQQNAGSVTPPAGFTNYLGTTSSSAYSVPTGEAYSIYHLIEGFNSADLGWGTADAQTVTLSFKVRSSLTGTFGGTIGNAIGTRSYPFSYTITAANTWETKTITIPGDTTGTWVGATNGIGIAVLFSLGAGASLLGTASSWSGNAYYGATGQVNIVGTNGATFYITGVQLEKGSTATSFDYRPYGTELALCQRYFCKSYPIGTSVGANTGFNAGIEDWYSMGKIRFYSIMRSSPSITTWDSLGNSGKIAVNGADNQNYFATPDNISDSGFKIWNGGNSTNRITFHWSASAEL